MFTGVITANDKGFIEIHTENADDQIRLIDLSIPVSGVTVAANRLLFSMLPYQFQYKTATLKRSMLFMEQGIELCVVDRIITQDRAKKFLFSQPTNLFLSRRLYQHITLPEITSLENGAVDLVKFFAQQSEESLLITSQISYGVELDKILAQLPEKSKLYRDGSAYDTTIAQMFAKNRVNYGLFYPQSLFEYGFEMPARSYEIAHIAPFVLGRLMCTNTPKMQIFIDEVNKNLTQLYQDERLLDIHLQYLQPNDAAVFKHYFQKMLDEVNQTTH